MPVAEKTDKYGRQLMDITSILFMQNRMVFVDNVITDELAHYETAVVPGLCKQRRYYHGDQFSWRQCYRRSGNL